MNPVSRLLFWSGLHSTRVRLISSSSIRRDIFKIQDEADFKDKVLNSKEPVVVDFFATWCGPCKLLEPRLETAIASQKGSVHLAKVDIDELDSIAAKYDVTSLPTVYAFKKGKPIDHFIGLRDQDVIQAFVSKAAE